MPKFIYTIILIAILIAYSLYFLVTNFAPTNIFIIIGFFILLYVFSTILLSLIIFLFKFSRLKISRVNFKEMYRNAFKYSFKFSLFVVLIIIIRTLIKHLW